MSPRSKTLDEALVRSELFDADPDLAVRLWKDDFRPKPAEDLVTWDKVAHKATVFGLPIDDRIRSTDVIDVERREDSDGSVRVKLDDSEIGWVEVDELAEVWAK